MWHGLMTVEICPSRGIMHPQSMCKSPVKTKLVNVTQTSTLFSRSAYYSKQPQNHHTYTAGEIFRTICKSRIIFVFALVASKSSMMTICGCCCGSRCCVTIQPNSTICKRHLLSNIRLLHTWSSGKDSSLMRAQLTTRMMCDNADTHQLFKYCTRCHSNKCVSTKQFCVVTWHLAVVRRRWTWLMSWNTLTVITRPPKWRFHR